MSVTATVIRDDRGAARCWWCGQDPLYQAYHDSEWGMPVADDRRLFEKLCLEGFQAGLSWLTILRKREHFRRAFDDFDFVKVARFTGARVDKLVADAGIVRHRGKIESTINNARRAVEMVDGGASLAGWCWRFEPPTAASGGSLPSETAESRAMSKELKRLGWSFVGPTTVYAFMQAVGMVNDHLPECDRHEQVARARRRFRPPEFP